MSRQRLTHSSIVGKAAIAVVAFALALTAVAWVAVRATGDATKGAAAVEREFSERVRTDAAMRVAQSNFRLAHARLRATDAREVRALDRQIDASDAQLIAAISDALSVGDFTAAEERVVARIRAAYPAYITARERIVSGGAPGTVDTEANRNRLRDAFDRLQAAQEAYGAGHFAEAGQDLRTLRAGRRWRERRARDRAGLRAAEPRRRAPARPAGRGPGARVRRVRRPGRRGRAVDAPALERGRQLAALADSLNAMVEELSAAAHQRKAVLAGDRAYRAAQDAFSDAMQAAETEHEAHGVIKLHIERWVPDSQVVVLNRRSVTDELEASTPLPDGSAMRAALQDAEPRACLAVRLARTHDSAAEPPPLLECELCGRAASESTASRCRSAARSSARCSSSTRGCCTATSIAGSRTPSARPARRSRTCATSRSPRRGRRPTRSPACRTGGRSRRRSSA